MEENEGRLTGTSNTPEPRGPGQSHASISIKRAAVHGARAALAPLVLIIVYLLATRPGHGDAVGFMMGGAFVFSSLAFISVTVISFAWQAWGRTIGLIALCAIIGIAAIGVLSINLDSSTRNAQYGGVRVRIPDWRAAHATGDWATGSITDEDWATLRVVAWFPSDHAPTLADIMTLRQEMHLPFRGRSGKLFPHVAPSGTDVNQGHTHYLARGTAPDGLDIRLRRWHCPASQRGFISIVAGTNDNATQTDELMARSCECHVDTHAATRFTAPGFTPPVGYQPRPGLFGYRRYVRDHSELALLTVSTSTNLGLGLRTDAKEWEGFARRRMLDEAEHIGTGGAAIQGHAVSYEHDTLRNADGLIHRYHFTVACGSSLIFCIASNPHPLSASELAALFAGLRCH